MGSVQPTQWVLPNRMNFTEWIYQTFYPTKYEDADGSSSAESTEKVALSPHQKLIRDLMNDRTPYRGLLMYHGLGVGKTRSSVLAAEDFIRNRKKIVVMLPASLQKNYRNEILMSSRVGRLRWRWWRTVTLNTSIPLHLGILLSLQEEFPIEEDFIKKYTKKGTTVMNFWIPFIPRGLEKEIPPSMMGEPQDTRTLTTKEQKQIQDIHTYFVDHTYQFINYNGLLKSHLTTKYKSDFFENKLVIIDEAHNFITQSMKEENIAAKLYQRLMFSKHIRLLLLSGTPLINKPIEIAYMMNLIRGPIPTAVYDFGKRAVPSGDVLEKALTQGIEVGEETIAVRRLLDTIEPSTDPKKNTLEMTLVPYGFYRSEGGAGGAGGASTVEWNEALAQWSPDQYKTTLNQFFETHLKALKTKTVWETHYALPTDEKKFKELFLETTSGASGNRLEIKNETLFIQRCLGMVSYYKVNTKYFPRMKPMVVRNLPLTDHQFMVYIQNRHDEQKMERKKALAKIRRGGTVEDDGNNVYRTFSRMACNFVFPKAIPRQFPMTIRAALREMDDVHFKDAEDMEKRVEEKYESERHKAMLDLAAGGDAYLGRDALADLYSPKMAAMLDDIAGNTGKGLFYSQFREMEGLGIFTLALQQAGWRPLEIQLGDGGIYEFQDKTVLRKEFDHKRYIVFNQDRTRSDILLKIFNGEWNQMPKEGQGLIQLLKKQGLLENLRGSLAKLMMITQSGAEGISLKEVREVYLMEPFWNQVRIDQVIGRASRTNSHAKLPMEERTVQVYQYIATFTKEQIEKDHTMRHLDNEQTSDQHILQIAQNKRHILAQFENALKRAAIDCLNHAENNEARLEKLQCYVAPIHPPADLADAGAGAGASLLHFMPDIQDHLKLQERQAKRIQRSRFQAKRVPNDKSRVRIPGDPNHYDARAYEHAGVLVGSPSGSAGGAGGAGGARPRKR